MAQVSGRTVLELNVTAPIFELEDINGRTINLQDYKGKKVFIGFFRHAGCPFCNLRVNFLKKKYLELKDKNLEMIFFFESNERQLLGSTFHKSISPIPLISDPQKIWYETYGLETSTSKSSIGYLTSFIKTAIQAQLVGVPNHKPKGGESLDTVPAEFLLDENLIIRKIHYSESLKDRMAIEHIYEFVGKG